MQQVIRVDGLVKQYQGVRALGPVSFTVGPGATGLLGPNGAGKTTLLATLLGVLDPTTGRGQVLGRDIVARSLDVRQSVGYMPERDAYIPDMSGVRFVAYCGEMAGLPKGAALQRAHEVLNYVGLEEERYRIINTYSTGMRQKAKLAQALVHDPKLLFLDEPTNGLDPRGRDEMLALIQDISRNRGIHVVLSSHLLPDVEQICSDVVVLNKGRVVAQGDLQTLRQGRGDTWTVRIKGPGERFVAALQAVGMKAVPGPGSFVVSLGTQTDPTAILTTASRAGVQVRTLRSGEASLEQLFVQLVEGGEPPGDS